MPAATNRKAIQCSILARSFRIQAPRKAVKIGPMYWRMIALDEVVSLLAETNRIIVAE